VSGFDLESTLHCEPDFLTASSAPHNEQANAHASDIHSFSYVTDGTFGAPKLEQFLAVLVESVGVDLFRCKGIISVAGMSQRIVLQGVQMRMGADEGNPWAEGEARISRLVFIGRDLPERDTLDSLSRCLISPFDLKWAIDLHVHSAPCLFHRMGDDLQVATMARDEGMRAIEYDALFSTSHLSPDEIVKHGAYIEKCSTLVIPSRHRKGYRYDYELLSATIKLVGADHCVMSTDAGMLVGSLYPHEQIRMFGERMQGYDISRQEVETMMCKTPATLVGL